MIWWYWVVLGLLLTGLELATPGGFFVIFFGVGALLVGGLVVDRRWRSGLGAVAAVHGAVGRRRWCSSASRCCA